MPPATSNRMTLAPREPPSDGKSLAATRLSFIFFLSLPGSIKILRRYHPLSWNRRATSELTYEFFPAPCMKIIRKRNWCWLTKTREKVHPSHPRQRPFYNLPKEWEWWKRELPPSPTTPDANVGVSSGQERTLHCSSEGWAEFSPGCVAI